MTLLRKWQPGLGQRDKVATFDFKTIRGESVEGQRPSFEQLVCRLAELEEHVGEFRRIHGTGGDGGVEAFWLLDTGKKIGYQSKFFTDKVDWSQMDKSVTTALTNHPELEQYVFAIPRDFTGRRGVRGGSTDGEWGKWDEWTEIWGNTAKSKGIEIKFKLWTAFDIEGALKKPDAAHLIPYFFSHKLAFSQKWLQEHFNRTLVDLQARYSPDDHIDTKALRAFDVIQRRETVRSDLRSIFTCAEKVNLRGAAELLPGVSVDNAMIAAAEGLLKDFMALGPAVELPLTVPWPVCHWLMRWNMATRLARDVMYQISDRVPADDDALRCRVAEACNVYPLTGAEVFGGMWMQLLPIDGARSVLFSGRAGAGKSHLLARGAESAMGEGVPVVHLLGQHILDNDPRVSILKHMELGNCSFLDALAALDLAAEIAGMRAMLIIDALNEGRGLDVWRNHLSSFVRDVNQYKRVVLVVSCREEYLPYVIPDDLIANPRPYGGEDDEMPRDCEPLGKLIQVSVEGFRSSDEREAALRQFVDAKGIARPTAPILNDEFFNPLFLSSVCRSMSKAGIKVFPRGLNGTSELFSFVLKTKVKAFGTQHDGTPPLENAMLVALHELASFMVEAKDDKVPLNEANALINKAFATMPVVGRTWLTILEGSDILRRDVEPADGPITSLSRPNEVIRFSFQRLQDHLLAQGLVRKCHDIDKAFEIGGPLEFLIERTVEEKNVRRLKPAKHWVGLLGAIWTAVAEQRGKELSYLPSFWRGPDEVCYNQDLRSVFLPSIRERRGDAFSSQTRELFDRLWHEEYLEKRLEILLSTSCIPDHAWNALDLSKQLLSMSKKQRDESWARPLQRDDSPLAWRAIGLADWAVNVNVSSADGNVVHLASIALVWLSVAENQRLRKHAKQGLANLVRGQPNRISELASLFSPEEVEIHAVLDAVRAMTQEAYADG